MNIKISETTATPPQNWFAGSPLGQGNQRTPWEQAVSFLNGIKEELAGMVTSGALSTAAEKWVVDQLLSSKVDWLQKLGLDWITFCKNANAMLRAAVAGGVQGLAKLVTAAGALGTGVLTAGIWNALATPAGAPDWKTGLSMTGADPGQRTKVFFQEMTKELQRGGATVEGLRAFEQVRGGIEAALKNNNLELARSLLAPLLVTLQKQGYIASRDDIDALADNILGGKRK